MKRLLTFLLLVLVAQAVWAQNSTKLSYQAVVRNANNELVANVPVTVEVSILDATSGAAWYTETHSVTTNANGLIALMVGEGTPVSGNLKYVAWDKASIKTSIGANGENIDNTTTVNAVPYALYADSAKTINHDVLNSLLQGLNITTFTNDAGYLTQATVMEAANIPTKVSAFQNDAHYVNKDVDSLTYYAKLTDLPTVNNATLTIKQGETELGTFTANAAEEKTINIPEVDLTDYAKKTEIPDVSGFITNETDPTVKDATITFKQGETTLGSFTTNSGTETTISIPVVVEPDLSDYAKLTDIPTVPTKVSELENDEGYLKEHQDLSDYAKKTEIPTVPTKVSELENDEGYLKEHQDLSDYAKKTEIPDVSGFIRNETDPTVKDATITFVQGETTLGTFTTNSGTATTITIPVAPVAPAQVQANWNETDESSAAFIKNKPTIPEVTEYNEACLSTTFCELVNTVSKLAHTVDSLKDVIANLNNNATLLVSTDAATISPISGKVIATGTVISKGASELQFRGFVYSKDEAEPTIDNSDKLNAEGAPEEGEFSVTLDELENNETYYLRAFAENEDGISYGEVIEFTNKFTCGRDKIADYEKNEYRTVQIGTQCWMQENMRATKYADGTQLTQWSSSDIKNANTKKIYATVTQNDLIGGTQVLYTWAAANNRFTYNTNQTLKIQGICPGGWHIPSYTEFATLFEYVDTLGGLTKSWNRGTETWTSNGNESNTLNSSNQLAIKLCAEDGHWKAYKPANPTTSSAAADSWPNISDKQAPGYAFNPDKDHTGMTYTWNTSGFSAYPAGYVNKKSFGSTAQATWYDNGTLNLWTSISRNATNTQDNITNNFSNPNCVKIACYNSGVPHYSYADEWRSCYSVRCVKD